MPFDQVGGYRGGARDRYNARSVNQALKLAKQAMSMKKKYDKAKPKTTRKPRSDKGKSRKSRFGPARATTSRRNVTSGVHTYSKLKHKSYKYSDLVRKFPQVLSQTYYITSPETYTDLNPGIDGTITNPDMLYSEPSVLWTNSSIHLFNVHNTEKHWLPTRGVENAGYRTGTQLTNVPPDPDRQLGTVSTFINDSFIFLNDPLSTKLVSVQCPFKQNGLAENAVGAYAGGSTAYTIPNSGLMSLNINLKVGNPTIQDEYITLKVIRLNDGDTTLEPGTLGADNAQRVALTQTICNSGKFTNPQQFSTIHSERHRVRGLRVGTKMTYLKLRKNLSLNYLRSNYRKQYNANNLTTIGLDAQPSYVLSDDDTFFNGVFIVLQSQCIDDQYVATVSVETASGNPEYTETGIPQIASYPPLGIPSTELGGKYKPIATGAQHCVSGTIQVFHRVASKRRAVGSTTQEALNSVQAKCVDLEKQLSSLALSHQKKDRGLTGKFRREFIDSESDS
jgi:hypothetical protein